MGQERLEGTEEVFTRDEFPMSHGRNSYRLVIDTSGNNLVLLIQPLFDTGSSECTIPKDVHSL